MPVIRAFNGQINVLDAARRRIEKSVDLFDNLAVAWTGGKDSTVCMHILREFSSQVNVLFRDEEILPEAVISYAREIQALPWVKFYWICLPMESDKFIMGKSEQFIQWERGRPHLRPMPDGARTPDSTDNRTFDQYSRDIYNGELFKGSLGLLSGIRAEESRMRYRSVVNKQHEHYITASASKKVKIIKPIYDWSEKDVWRYHMDFQIPYCKLYRYQHMAGENLRLSTALQAETAKDLGRWRGIEPEFYDRIMQRWPEMAIQERYGNELESNQVVLKQYGRSYAGVMKYIRENVAPSKQKSALRHVKHSISLTRADPGAFTPLYLLRSWALPGLYQRKPLPIRQERREAERKIQDEINKTI